MLNEHRIDAIGGIGAITRVKMLPTDTVSHVKISPIGTARPRGLTLFDLYPTWNLCVCLLCCILF